MSDRIMKFEEFDISEMAKIETSDFNLPRLFWFDDLSGSIHSPRIKVSKDKDNKVRKDNFFPLSISRNPEVKGEGYKNMKPNDYKKLLNISVSELEEMKNFVIKNYDIFMKLYNNKISQAKCISELFEMNS